MNKLVDSGIYWAIDQAIDHSELTFKLLEKCSIETKQWIAESLIEKKAGAFVAANLDKFRGIDQKKIAIQLIDYDIAGEITANLEKFDEIDQTWIIEEFKKNDEFIQLVLNVDKFDKVSDQSMLDLLIDNEFYVVTLKYLKNFKNIDKNQLVKKLIDKFNGGLVAANIEQFPETDENWLVDELERTMGLYEVPRNLEKFHKIDHLDLYQRLEKKGFISEVAFSLHKFKGINHQELASKLISKGKLEVLVANLNKFNDLNHEEIITEVINQEPDGRLLLKCLENFNNLKPINWEKVISASVVFSYGKQTEKLRFYLKYMNDEEKRYLTVSILKNKKSLELMPELFIIQSAEVKQLLNTFSKKEIINLAKAYKVDKCYKQITILIQQYGLKPREVKLEYQDIEKQITQLAIEKNTNHALDLLRLAKIIYPNKKVELEKLENNLGQEKTQKGEPKERTRFIELNCSKEIIKYYLNISLTKKYGKLIFNQDNEQQALYQKISQPIESLFEKIKEYMVIAVSSEMRHSSQIQNEITEEDVTGKNIYHTSSNEDVRIFFKNAKEKFIHNKYFSKEKRRTFGGKLWSNIASVAEQVWQENTQVDFKKKIAFINIIIGFQHNSGLFFDKDRSRVKLNNKELKELLDFEATGNRNMSDFLDYGLKNNILTPEEVQYYLDLEKEFEEHKSSLKAELNPEQVYQENFQKVVRKDINKVLANKTLPNEIKIAVSNSFDIKEGFSKDQNGFVLLARLQDTMKIKWQEDDGTIKKYHDDKNTFYHISIEGYKLAFWYKNGRLQIFNNLSEVKEKSQELSSIFDTQIVEAQFGYLREGD